MSDRQRILEETNTARAKAMDLLKALTEAKDSVEGGSKDLYKRVTGQSSIDNSIAATRRTIEAYNKVIAQLEVGGAQPVVTVPGAQPQRHEVRP